MIYTKDAKKRLLKAEEIECRVGQVKKDGSKYSVLLYKTSRTDMDILDEVFGSENWKSTHYEVKGKDFCMIEVRIPREDGFYDWVGKSDCGSESNIEAEKGEASDAFKRAGFQWGIGRELYSAPKIWLNKEVNAYDLKVEQIEYDDSDKICTLLLSAKGEIVYQFRNGKGVKPEARKPVANEAEVDRIRDISAKLEFEGKNLDEILNFYKVKTIGEIPLEKWEKMLAKARGEI